MPGPNAPAKGVENDNLRASEKKLNGMGRMTNNLLQCRLASRSARLQSVTERKGVRPTTIRRWTLTLVVAAVILPGPAVENSAAQPRPTWIAEYGYLPQDLADFAFGNPGVPDVPIITVTIQGSPFPLIFDTGTNGYASLDSDVIARLQLPVKGWTMWRDSSGKPVARIPWFGRCLA
jgi:hypothetical protein